MALASIYARFSSDSQRDESIEIQVEYCQRLIKQNGWVLGEVYTDYARTGRTDDRPGFQRCISDGVAGKYDILVIYKTDRFARNVEIAQHYKRKLFEAGVELHSVREGEVKDTPEGFLFSGMTDLWADYYSRNLSVQIREGNQKNAKKLKASGVRRYGYDVDENDHFIINESEAEVVREVFSMYLDGYTSNQIAAALNARGIPTARGARWQAPPLLKMIKNPAYIGTYSYAGHVVEDAIPAIIDKGAFYLAQEITNNRTRGKRMSVRSEYVLSNKLYCLTCGSSMSGTSGTSATGKKYRYYTCSKKKDGCAHRISADTIEKIVTDAVSKMLNNEETINMMTADMIAYSNTIPDKSQTMKDERSDLLKERDRLVDSIAQGVPASAVGKRISSLEERIQDLNQKIEVEVFRASQKPDEELLRESMQALIENINATSDRANLFVSNFVERVYVDAERVIILFKYGNTPDDPPSHKEILELVDLEPDIVKAFDLTKRSSTITNKKCPREAWAFLLVTGRVGSRTMFDWRCKL